MPIENCKVCKGTGHVAGNKQCEDCSGVGVKLTIPLNPRLIFDAPFLLSSARIEDIELPKTENSEEEDARGS